MSETWFTSDHHLGHANIIKHCQRPFQSVEEMDAALIERWNAVVQPKDMVYHLGDLIYRSAKDPLEYLRQINGRIHLITGNHDRDMLKNLVGWKNHYFEEIEQLKVIKLDHQKIVLCHYAMRVWPDSHRGSWHLYGHSHGTLPPHGNSFDVGVDGHDFTPLSFQKVRDTIAALEVERQKLLEEQDWFKG